MDIPSQYGRVTKAKIDLFDVTVICQNGSQGTVLVLPIDNQGLPGTLRIFSIPIPGQVVDADLALEGDPLYGGLYYEVAGSGSSNALLFQKQNSDGTLSPPVQYATGLQPTAMAIATRGGMPSIHTRIGSSLPADAPSTPIVVTSNAADDTVSVLWGDGGGAYLPHVDYPAGPSNAAPQFVILGDFNSDGNLDIAVTSSVTGSTGVVSILLGNGDGTFQVHVDYPTGSGPVYVTAADLNGDGTLDLAVANQNDNTVSVLLGNGDGTFQPRVDYSAGSAPFLINVADFNNDGALDLIVTSASEAVVLPGNGDGTFPRHLDAAVGAAPVALARGDFNGDGTQDVVVANSNDGTISILFGNGDGTYQAPLNVTLGGTPSAVVVGDVNGDGKPDIAVGLRNGSSASGNVAILLGNGDGTFQPATYLLAGTRGFSDINSLAAADLNGDGKLDLVGSDLFFGAVQVLLGRGDGTFENSVSYSALDFPANVIAGDFDGDGKLDLAVATIRGSVSILLGNGDGTFKPAVAYPVGPSFLNPSAAWVASGDFNGDGKLDLAVAIKNPSNQSVVSILLGKGDGTFQAAVDIPASGRVGQVGAFSIAVSDLDNDGKLDLIVRNRPAASGLAGLVSVLLGHGDGTFRRSRDFAAGAGANAESGMPGGGILVGDFNNDGGLDIATVNSQDNTLSVFLAPAVIGISQPTDFGNQAVGQPSPPQTIMVRNLAAVPLVISSIGASGDFSQTNNCIGTIPVRGFCGVDVVFTPTAAGPRTGILTLLDNATKGLPQVVTLTGTGIQPPVPSERAVP